MCRDGYDGRREREIIVGKMVIIVSKTVIIEIVGILVCLSAYWGGGGRGCTWDFSYQKSIALIHSFIITYVNKDTSSFPTNGTNINCYFSIEF